MKRILIMFLVSSIFVLITEYLFKSIDSKQLLDVMTFTFRHVALIGLFTIVIYCIFKFSSNSKKITPYVFVGLIFANIDGFIGDYLNLQPLFELSVLMILIYILVSAVLLKCLIVKK